ncbi:unnamed protein product [Coregonus sp. 'balchen']|nr:unnamed protein product [Coregonus sp. 'balchen']
MAEENIFLFVPNLIGYARIVLALLAFYLMPCCPVPAVFFYLLSALLDAFDGHAARALNQGTKFGAMLDMLTDRCATMCLLVNLALLYPSYTFLFQISMSLDISSHWLHLHSVAAVAAWCLCRGVCAEVCHQRSAPDHRLQEHGCHRHVRP